MEEICTRLDCLEKVTKAVTLIRLKDNRRDTVNLCDKHAAATQKHNWTTHTIEVKTI